MATSGAEAPNAAQAAYWNDQAGPQWVALQAQIDAQIRPLGALVLARAELAPGQHVLDVGCGCGDTTIELARRVAPGGQVTGIDLSAPMLAQARAQAAAAGVAVELLQADAQTYAFAPASFDRIVSRFGVMFFADPAAAFANLCGALRPGGRLAFVCWQAMTENPWTMVPCLAALPHLPPQTPPDPTAPGPFAFADAARVRAILTGAGFTAVALEPIAMTLSVGGGADLDATVTFLLQMGPVARLVRELGDPSLTARIAASVREALAPFAGPDGVRLGSASWIVTAQRPA